MPASPTRFPLVSVLPLVQHGVGGVERRTALYHLVRLPFHRGPLLVHPGYSGVVGRGGKTQCFVCSDILATCQVQELGQAGSAMQSSRASQPASHRLTTFLLSNPNPLLQGPAGPESRRGTVEVIAAMAVTAPSMAAAAAAAALVGRRRTTLAQAGIAGRRGTLAGRRGSVVGNHRTTDGPLRRATCSEHGGAAVQPRRTTMQSMFAHASLASIPIGGRRHGRVKRVFRVCCVTRDGISVQGFSSDQGWNHRLGGGYAAACNSVVAAST